jgi:hypothetical protein
MKGLFVGIVLIIVLGLSGVLLSVQNHSTPVPSNNSSTVSYTSAQGDIAFEYRNSYDLTERNDSFEGKPIRVLTLTGKDVVIPDMSEGPPAISLVIVPNPENLPLQEWVQTKSISNFQLSATKTFTPITVGGEQGVSYTHSGLYESTATALAHQGNIYVFSVGSTDPTEPLVTDFQNLLKTVQFK